MAASLVAGVATLIFNITTLNFENSIIRPNGNLLLTTISNGSLYEIDPSAASPEAKLVATFGGANVLGINSIGLDKYAIVGGLTGDGGLSGYINSSVYTVDLSTNATSPVVTVAATIPDAQLLDGLVALPEQTHVLLVTDALQGVIYRVDTDTGVYDIVGDDDAFAGSPGVNGIKILNGYAYFMNTAAETYGRFAITEDGELAGDIEIIATDASSDDFALDANGIAYLGRQESPIAVVQILPNGTKTDIATASTMGRPCSLDLAQGGEIGYVTTASGQVFEFEIPAV
jgi:hypothetical protein